MNDKPYIHTCRVYGEPKISRPKELKGLKPVKEMYLNKSNRKTQMYILDGDAWVYFPDLFSKEMAFPESEDMMLPASALAEKYNLARKKHKTFVYADAWCRIYNRNEGWVVFPSLVKAVKEARFIFELHCRLSDEFLRLSFTDTRFQHLSMQRLTERAADYDRIIGNIISYIFQHL